MAILVVAVIVCALGWFFSSVAAEAMSTWIKSNGLQPTEEEVRVLVRKAIYRRFGLS